MSNFDISCLKQDHWATTGSSQILEENQQSAFCKNITLTNTGKSAIIKLDEIIYNVRNKFILEPGPCCDYCIYYQDTKFTYICLLELKSGRSKKPLKQLKSGLSFIKFLFFGKVDSKRTRYLLINFNMPSPIKSDTRGRISTVSVHDYENIYKLSLHCSEKYNLRDIIDTVPVQ